MIVLLVILMLMLAQTCAACGVQRNVVLGVLAVSFILWILVVLNWHGLVPW